MFVAKTKVITVSKISKFPYDPRYLIAYYSHIPFPKSGMDEILNERGYWESRYLMPLLEKITVTKIITMILLIFFKVIHSDHSYYEDFFKKIKIEIGSITHHIWWWLDFSAGNPGLGKSIINKLCFQFIYVCHLFHPFFSYGRSINNFLKVSWKSEKGV